MSASGRRLVKLAMCQMMVGTDKAANLEAARAMVRGAAEKGAQVVALPEVFNSPYAVDSFAAYAEEIPDKASDVSAEQHPSSHMLVNIAKETKVWLVGGSFPEKDADGKVYNTCLVVSPEGNFVAKHRKMHLFDISIKDGITFRESDTLTAGDSMTVFDTPFCKIGVGICYDMRFAQYAMLMRQAGCELLVYPGAFNTTTGPLHWELLQRARAVDNQVFVATASPARNPESKYQAWGHSSIVDPWGKVLATTEHGVDTVFHEIDLGEVDTIRESIPISKQMRSDLYESVKLLSKQ